jgi:hypothetical protein
MRVQDDEGLVQEECLGNAEKICATYTHPPRGFFENMTPLPPRQGKATKVVVFREENMIASQVFVNKSLNKVEEPKHRTDQHLSKWRGE